MRLPALPLTLLATDSLVVSRRTPTIVSPGNDSSTPVVVASITRGTYSRPTAADKALAGERSSVVDAIVAFPPATDIRTGDFINVRGLDFEVVAVEDARNRVRAHIRRYREDTANDDA